MELATLLVPRGDRREHVSESARQSDAAAFKPASSAAVAMSGSAARSFAMSADASLHRAQRAPTPAGQARAPREGPRMTRALRRGRSRVRIRGENAAFIVRRSEIPLNDTPVARMAGVAAFGRPSTGSGELRRASLNAPSEPVAASRPSRPMSAAGRRGRHRHCPCSSCASLLREVPLCAKSAPRNGVRSPASASRARTKRGGTSAERNQVQGIRTRACADRKFDVTPGRGKRRVELRSRPPSLGRGGGPK